MKGGTLNGLVVAGIVVANACYNTFVENDLEDNFNDVGAIFDFASGANTWLGDDDDVVLDFGAFDCDDDGVDDPNIILDDDDEGDDDDDDDDDDEGDDDDDGEGGNN